MNTLNSNIKEDLLKVKSIHEENLEIFSKSTRDKNNIHVKIDKKSEVIFIDDFYVGDTTYVRGNYRHINYLNSKISGKNYEDF